MHTDMIITAAVVLAAFVVLLFVIRRYPLVVVRRELRCPESSLPALVHFIRGETGFGNFVIQDVASCSLYPEGPPTCSKQCMR